MLHAVIGLLVRILPPTIHPMLVHFPIVLLYMGAAVALAGRFGRDGERFFQRVSLYTLTLACFFTVITMAAGLVSEQSVHWTPALNAILQRHQHFAILTGASEGAAWLLQVFTRFPAGEGWSIFGRGRATWPSTLLVVLAAVFVTLTARLGGQMVYDHGVGVLGVTRIRA